MINEVWRCVPSLPGILVSSIGRYMTSPYQGVMPHGGKRWYGGEPTYGRPDDSGRLGMTRNGKNHRIHRLVCEAFHGPAPFPRAVVMHLDEDQTNNRADNLKWGTQKENLNAPGFIAYCRSRTGSKNPAIKGRRQREAAQRKANHGNRDLSKA